MMKLANAPLVPLGWQTIGPFFPRDFIADADHDLTRLTPDAAPTAQGEPIILRGRVMQQAGGACVNAVLEAWQADADGRFKHPLDPGHASADPGFLGWGRTLTDTEGCYEFRTILPGGYADQNGPRAPHINLAILASGIMRRLVTTLYFPDFATANALDPVLSVLPEPLRPLLLAQPASMEAGHRVFRFDLLLRGDPQKETPFFID